MNARIALDLQKNLVEEINALLTRKIALAQQVLEPPALAAMLTGVSAAMAIQVFSVIAVHARDGVDPRSVWGVVEKQHAAFVAALTPAALDVVIAHRGAAAGAAQGTAS